MKTPLPHLWRQWASHLVGLVLPPTCLSCEAVLATGTAPSFCPDCYQALPRWDRQRIIAPVLPPHVASLSAPFLYQSHLRDALLRFKFGDQPQFARVFARLMLPSLPPSPPDQLWLLVPVPVHPVRLRQRGFNQAALLARHLARLSNQNLALTGLTRTTLGPHQAGRTKAQRRRLPGHHFLASPAVNACHVLLIDDIYTTGATARACALALKRGGALSVHVLTLAYTPPAMAGL